MAAALALQQRDFVAKTKMKEGFWIWSGAAEVFYFTVCVCVALPSSLTFTAGKQLSFVFQLSADTDVIILRGIHDTSQKSFKDGVTRTK